VRRSEGTAKLCIARIPGHPNIRVDRRSAPAICGRHHRWLDTTGQHPDQVDLANNIEVITAFRRFQRLLSPVDDPAWARQQLCRTTGIVTQWHHHRDRHSFSHSIFKELPARWDARARTLPSSGSATPLPVMPEAVTLAEILCDPQWRRHVAVADEYDLLPFYRQVARRLGQPTKFSDRLAYTRPNDPLKSWVIEHRKQFRTLRHQQGRLRTGHPYDPRFPDAIQTVTFIETRRPVATPTDLATPRSELLSGNFCLCWHCRWSRAVSPCTTRVVHGWPFIRGARVARRVPTCVCSLKFAPSVSIHG
jgi:hypothetical protein